MSKMSMVTGSAQLPDPTDGVAGLSERLERSGVMGLLKAAECEPEVHSRVEGHQFSAPPSDKALLSDKGPEELPVRLKQGVERCSCCKESFGRSVISDVLAHGRPLACPLDVPHHRPVDKVGFVHSPLGWS